MGQLGDQTRIKFCGLRRVEDVQCAVELGVDYVGFVLVPGTARSVDAEQVRRIQEEVDCSRVCRVGVFRGQTIDEINRLVQELSLDLVQWHGADFLSACARIAVPVIGMLPVPVPGDESLAFEQSTANLEQENLYAILLDASAADGSSGGMGVRADPHVLAQIRARIPATRRVMVAGGLTPENVRAIVHSYRPDVVDVSSGIELQPGNKDAERMRAFVDAVRGGDPS